MGKAFPFRQGVIAHEPYNGGHELSRWLDVLFLPAQVRPWVDALLLGHVLLGPHQFRPSLHPEIVRICGPAAAAGGLLAQAFGRLNLSARTYHRVLKPVRIIASFAWSKGVALIQVVEAIH